MLAMAITEMSARNLVVITQSVEKRSDCGQWICDEAGNVIETQEEGHSRQTIHARQLKLAVKDEVTSSAWAGEMKLQKNERPPMRRPLRILLKCRAGLGSSA